MPLGPFHFLQERGLKIDDQTLNPESKIFQRELASFQNLPRINADKFRLLARMFGPPPGADGDNDPVTQDLFARLMGIVQPSGDYVFSQNDFDRLMTDLMEQHQGNAPPPAKKEVLDHLPKIKVTEEMVLSNEDCAVCKEELVIDEELVKLPCNHHYHELCVRKWLESHDVSFRPIFAYSR